MTVQTIDTFKGYNVRVRMYIKSDGSGDAPADWDAGYGGSTGINLIGVATSVSTSATSDITDITGLNQQTPYNTKQGNISFEWSLDQFYTTSKWTDDTVTPVEFNPVNMIKSGKKFALQISGLDKAGEDDTATSLTDVTLTQCSIGSDELSIDGSEGDLTFSMSGKAADRIAA